MVTRDALLSPHSQIQLLLFALFVFPYYSLLFHPILNSLLCFPLSPFHILFSLLSSLLFSFLPSVYSPLLSLLIFYFLSYLLFPFPLLPPSPRSWTEGMPFQSCRVTVPYHTGKHPARAVPLLRSAPGMNRQGISGTLIDYGEVRPAMNHSVNVSLRSPSVHLSIRMDPKCVTGTGVFRVS